MTLVLLAGLSAGVLQDAHGNVIPGRQVNVYARGTSTPVQVYSDSAGSSPVTQPLTSDSSGQVPGYVAGGVSVDLVDALSGARMQAEPLFAGSVVSTVSAKAFGAKGDGTTDDTGALTAALGTGQDLFLPNGTYLVDGLNYNAEHQRIYAESRQGVILKAKPSASSGYVLRISGKRYCALDGLTIDGGGTTNADGLHISPGAATSQSQSFRRLLVQNAAKGIYIDNAGSTQADKNTFYDTVLLGNTIGFQSDSTNSQETIFIGVNVSFTANNQIGFKLNAAGGGATLGILGGQCQGTIQTGLTGIQITGTNLGWVWLKDYIDENVQTSIDGSVTWPVNGVIMEHAILQGATACVLMGPVDAGTIGGVLNARLCRFNGTGGTGLGGNGIIKSFATGSSPKAILEDCNIVGNAPQLTINGGALPVITPGEVPRFVGVGSNPGFNGATDFANAGGGYRNLCFYMDRGGVVHVEGQVKTVLGQATDTTIFTLPVGYRPATGSRVNATGSITSTNAFCRVDVDSSGNVISDATLAAGASLGFSISFMPAV